VDDRLLSRVVVCDGRRPDVRQSRQPTLRGGLAPEPVALDTPRHGVHADKLPTALRDTAEAPISSAAFPGPLLPRGSMEVRRAFREGQRIRKCRPLQRTKRRRNRTFQAWGFHALPVLKARFCRVSALWASLRRSQVALCDPLLLASGHGSGRGRSVAPAVLSHDAIAALRHGALHRPDSRQADLTHHP
jgi:hypothetical protein